MPRTPPIFAALAVAVLAHAAAAATVQLDDGRTLTGKIIKVGGVAERPGEQSTGGGEVRVESILVIDDGLRRTFVSSRRVRAILDDGGLKPIKIRVWQNEAKRGAVVGRVGRQVGVTPFDQYGRRIYEAQAPGGTLAVVQGITEITPVYTRVRALSAEPRNYVWDMRIATSSIPRPVLSRVLAKVAPPGDAEARLEVVRLYLQSERFRDARRELEALARDFPAMDDLQDDIRQIRQLSARTILAEIERRSDAGQHRLVRALLENFPSEEVAGATLERVREMLEELDTSRARQALVRERLEAAVAAIREPAAQAVAREVQAEIDAELGEATLPRMAAFLQLAGGGLSPEGEAALAISGWLLGGNNATDNLAVALSLFDVRAKVLAYLREESRLKRAELLVDLRDMEGASVERVADLLKLLKPPLPLPTPPAPPEPAAADGAKPADKPQAPTPAGCYEMTVPVGGERGTVRYLVQLPPEYDPLRNYPAVVTLAGLGYTPRQQLDYWAGAPTQLEEGKPPVRRGQAMRRGYITIAVDWQHAGQFEYEYTAPEHQAVLASLRHAMRRLAIDADRVFLTGHDIGGDAAWDIGAAHPDLWAGVVPILARADRYVGWYWKNAEFVPWYFVAGEMDGGKTAHNARELDRYLKRVRYDATLAEFLGRGHEPFTDEIQRLFDWMGRKRRRPAPEEADMYTMRPWDSFFWWAEVRGLLDKSMVTPGAWPPARGVRAARIQLRKYAGNKLGLRVRAGGATVWLSPDVVDFAQPIRVELNGSSIIDRDNPVQPELGVLLEDVRTRGDRFRPFWAKVSWP
ncbi:MAG: peptidase [Planctomycetota bacterium]